MFQVTSDKSKSLLKVHFSRHVNFDEARQCLEQIKSLLKDVRSGFTLLTDLTGLESMDPTCAPQVEATMDACRKAGVSRVVRVIPDPHKDIGLSIMSFFHYGRRVQIVTCETRDEAVRILAE